jgi:hypothetical protein
MTVLLTERLTLPASWPISVKPGLSRLIELAPAPISRTHARAYRAPTWPRGRTGRQTGRPPRGPIFGRRLRGAGDERRSRLSNPTPTETKPPSGSRPDGGLLCYRSKPVLLVSTNRLQRIRSVSNPKALKATAVSAMAFSGPALRASTYFCLHAFRMPTASWTE